MSDENERSVASAGSAADRITEYLCHGGLCNPELMQHDRVRDLLIDCRDEVARLRLTDAERDAVALMAEVAADPRGVAVYAGYEVAATLRGLLERAEGTQ